MIKYILFYLHNSGTFLLSMERLHLISSWEQLLCDWWNSVEHAEWSDDAEVDIRTDGNDECSDRAVNIILETVDNQVQDKVEEEDCYGIDSQPGWHSVPSPLLLQISVSHFYKRTLNFCLILYPLQACALTCQCWKFILQTFISFSLILEELPKVDVTGDVDDVHAENEKLRYWNNLELRNRELCVRIKTGVVEDEWHVWEIPRQETRWAGGIKVMGNLSQLSMVKTSVE